MTTLDEHARAGMAAINDKRFDEAITSFQAAIALDGDRPDINSALGMAYMHRGEVITALPYLTKAHELAKAYTEPEHLSMRKHFATSLASAHAVLDAPMSAVDVLDDMIRSLPADVELRMQRASLLINSLKPEEGAAGYQAIAEDESVEEGIREAAEALSGAINAFLDDDDVQGGVFLQAHAESYNSFFAQHANKLEEEGWFTEAARMVRGADGEPKPMIAEGARPWALERVDIVNPADGNVAKVGDEKEPLIVAVNGLEPLAQVPVTLPWSGFDFEVWVCSRVPWHWLPILVEFADPVDEARSTAFDELVGAWYLAGYNGDYGTAEKGRFHYATDLEVVAGRAISGTFDLGRASFDAVEDLLRRLTVFHGRFPIARVVFGPGRLPNRS